MIEPAVAIIGKRQDDVISTIAPAGPSSVVNKRDGSAAISEPQPTIVSKRDGVTETVAPRDPTTVIGRRDESTSIADGTTVSTAVNKRQNADPTTLVTSFGTPASSDVAM